MKQWKNKVIELYSDNQEGSSQKKDENFNKLMECFNRVHQSLSQQQDNLSSLIKQVNGLIDRRDRNEEKYRMKVEQKRIGRVDNDRNNDRSPISKKDKQVSNNSGLLPMITDESYLPLQNRQILNDVDILDNDGMQEVNKKVNRDFNSMYLNENEE